MAATCNAPFILFVGSSWIALQLVDPAKVPRLVDQL